MGHYQKLEEFQITNKKIIDVSELLFSEYKIVTSGYRQIWQNMQP
jgi:hypothetical protein